MSEFKKLKVHMIKMTRVEPLQFIKDSINNANIFEDYYNNIFKKIEKYDIKTKKYNIGDSVKLDKGTLLHGIKSYSLEKIKSIKNEGILFSEYHGVNVVQQKFCVCLWIINNDILLKDYINNYSSETIHLQNRFTKKYKQIYIPYNYDVLDRQKLFRSINKLIYRIDFVRDSKENQFMPSLIKEDNYVGFIINNKYTSDIKKIDIYDGNIPMENLQEFLPDWVIKKTIKNKLPTQTDHELAIIYGIQSNLIEGIIVGKIIEKDVKRIKDIKNIFSNCYICNVNGEVIRD